MLKASGAVCETRIVEPTRLVDHPTQPAPLFLAGDRDHAPAIITPARIATLRDSKSRSVAPFLGYVPIGENLQQHMPERSGGRFQLRQVDPLPLAGLAAMFQSAENRKQAV